MSKYYFIDKYKINVYKYIDGKLHWLNYQGIWVLYCGYFGYKDINPFVLKDWYNFNPDNNFYPWVEMLKADIIKDILYED